MRLVRLCGLDLDLMLVERDDSDWAQARRQLALAPSDRIRRLQGVARLLIKSGEAGRAARDDVA